MVPMILLSRQRSGAGRHWVGTSSQVEVELELIAAGCLPAELCELIAPAIPTSLCAACEKFEVWTGHKPFYLLPNTIGFLAMFAGHLH